MAVGVIERIVRGGWKTRLTLALAALASAIVLVILVDSALSYNRIHSGVSITGIDVGRLNPAQAQEELERRTTRAANNTVVLAAESGEEWSLLPADVNLQVDAAATVAEAMATSRDGNLFQDLKTRLSLYFSGRDVPLSATLDPALLDTILGEAATALDRPPRNAGLSIEGENIAVIEGEDGLVVDVEAARNGVKQLLFSLSPGTVPVQMKVEAPAIQAADTSDAVEQAKIMLGGSVALEFEDQVWTLSPGETARAMDFTTEGEGADSRLVPYLSAEKLASFFADIATALKREPKDATWETDGETATLIPGRPGLILDPTKTAEALTEASLSSSSRVAQVVATETPPNRTTEQAEAMGIEAKLASYTTEFGGSDGRRKNVARAAEIINGTLLAPGEEFDFDAVVGKRTTENGFETAPAIVAGKLEETLGGGICQVSTTLFNAVFFAGLDVTARTNHSLYISHYPKGRDATVSWGGPAFRFRNDTDHWVMIKASASWSSLIFVIYGTPVNRQVTYTTGDWYGLQSPTEKRVKTDQLLEGQERVIDSGQTGRRVKVTRKVIEDGKTIHSDEFVSSYPMKPKIIEEGTKPTTTTTTAPPSTTTTTGTTSTTATTAP